MPPIDLPLHIVPPSTSHTHTVVFLHGRGDNVPNFARSLANWTDSNNRNLGEIYPSFRWVFPKAPLRRCANPPTTVIFQWFDVWDPRNLSQNEELQTEGLKEVVPTIRQVLADEAALLGGRWDKVILAGISMGGATSAHVLFNLDIPQEAGGRLGAFMGFSCRCPFAGRNLAEMREILALDDVPDHNSVLQKTPMLLEHCADDPLVLVKNGQVLRDTLRRFGAQVEWKEYPIGRHWFNHLQGVDDVVDFLGRCVPEVSEAQSSPQTRLPN